MAVRFISKTKTVGSDQSIDADHILIADRTGNVVEYTIPTDDDFDVANNAEPTKEKEEESAGKKNGSKDDSDTEDLSEDQKDKVILGHMSLLLDLAVSSEQIYLATCDRDEKIRISQYPNAYNIVAFCLGHKEFVKCVSFFKIGEQSKIYLISGSGDCTLRVWDFKKGNCVLIHDFMADIDSTHSDGSANDFMDHSESVSKTAESKNASANMQIRKLVCSCVLTEGHCSSVLVAVCFEDSPNLHILRLRYLQEASERISIEKVTVVDAQEAVWDLSFHEIQSDSADSNSLLQLWLLTKVRAKSDESSTESGSESTSNLLQCWQWVPQRNKMERDYSIKPSTADLVTAVSMASEELPPLTKIIQSLSREKYEETLQKKMTKKKKRRLDS